MVQRVSEPTATSHTDADLAGAAANGDGQAFDELYRRHADAAWRVAYAVTGNREDASDAVAEAFTRMLTALSAGRLADLDRFRPYLLATTRNAGIDVLRRTGRVHPTDTELADRAGPVTASPSERLLEGLDASLVASAFRSLPERWRSVLWLTEVEGMAPAEAAGLLGVSANGAAQLAVRARAGLRQRFLQAHLRADVDTDCRYTVERLGAYVGGGLAPRDIAKVDQHLAACEACSARRAELEEVGTTLRRVVAPMPLALGALAWRHWRQTVETASRTRKPLIAPGAQRALTGASLGLLGLGIIGASIIGQPSLGSTAGPRPAGSVPVGSSPVLIHEAAAATQGPAAPLPLALPGGGAVSAAPAPTSVGGASGAGGATTGGSAPAQGGTPSGGGLPGVGSQGGGGSQTVQLSSQINLSPAISATVGAGTTSTGATVTSPATGSQPVGVGTPPAATTPTTTPSASLSVTTPAASPNPVTVP